MRCMILIGWISNAADCDGRKQDRERFMYFFFVFVQNARKFHDQKGFYG